MYCKYCGRKSDGSTDVCPECEKNHAQVPQSKRGSVRGRQRRYTRKSGLWMAISAFILNFVEFLFYVNVWEPIVDGLYDNSSAGKVLWLFLSLLCFSFSAVMEIASIVTFKRAKTAGVKPVATLVIGIVGLVCSVYLTVFGLSLFWLI